MNNECILYTFRMSEIYIFVLIVYFYIYVVVLLFTAAKDFTNRV